MLGQVIERREDVHAIKLEDIVESEKEQNVDMVSEELDSLIISYIVMFSISNSFFNSSADQVKK